MHIHQSAIRLPSLSAMLLLYCMRLVRTCTASGGAQEAEAAYEEAVNAVFNLQVECHRHAQPHVSKKNGTTKWAMLEMWPMPVGCLSYHHATLTHCQVHLQCSLKTIGLQH